MSTDGALPSRADGAPDPLPPPSGGSARTPDFAPAMTILDRIVSDTRSLVERRKSEVPVRVLEQRPAFAAPTLSLVRALRTSAPEPAVIAEIKRASPSAGIIRRDFDPVDLARQYKAAGAAAISVLTEPMHFKGSLEHLAAVRLATDLPVLRKDFVIDEYQLIEARAYGADAVLLIAAVLDAVQLRDLHEVATSIGLTPLVEIYEEHELDRVDLDQVTVLGVNNRDLATFEVDPARAGRVLQQVPPSLVRVAESGLRTAEDLAQVRRDGLDAVLIGETFMRAPLPGVALRRLREDTRDLLMPPLRVAC
jgi:indole-3-glycerol phosphate synthase